jgi:D-beta-D-heptose 7-phosphate kinase/D-beta-D-heptose 1-phosphate adenosyltransferase
MRKIQYKKDLKKICSKISSEGKTVVFTNGCFDILHAGHVKHLKQAKKLGDVLVIGLNSDRSVSKIKPGRPINSQKRRAEVLAALSMVDYIAIFDEMTPYLLIKSLKPDILVKGGDWKKEDIVGHNIVKKTYCLPYIKGISTTRIIERIRKTSK